MKFTQEIQGTYSYLVYEIKDEVVDKLSLGMLENNEIPGILPILFTQMDDKKYLKYNISAKVSAREFLTGTVNRKRLLGVFYSIADALTTIDEYMIDVKSILLNLDYIYVDVTTCKAYMVCLPIMDSKQNIDIHMFLKEIMFSTQLDQTENCDYVATIINYLNSSAGFNINEFKEVINKLKYEQQETPTVSIAPVQIHKDNIQQTEIKNTYSDNKVVTDQAVAFEKKAEEMVQGRKETVNEVAFSPNLNKEEPSEKDNEKILEVPMGNTQQGDNKKVSMLNLLMHYSKENKELYKQQKQSKKSSKNTSNVDEKQKAKKKEKSTIGLDKKKYYGSSNFAIPGVNQQKEIPNTATSVGNNKLERTDVNGYTVRPSVQSDKEKSSQSAPIIQPKSTYATVSANFGETVVLNQSAGNGETTVLGAGAVQTPMQKQPYLVRLKNRERILLDKPVFRIGKEKSYVDYFISDNTAISRSHANIINKDEKFFVVDTNSTNHTFVNGEMIQSGAEIEILHGTKIQLANEEFEFKIY